ncbi:MAG: hypothetical protein EOQ50_18405 [Mesorhizobium sp.]|uniref:hypothetical protein n=1 Tax=Mesorhizobium sp. TaxID=1871066 RepID=UPI000FE6BF74|nr:hypothetical protein [Mesorhizobium sp.]RWB72940.1 MAG: hypothetical protein EOQ50_18405 [Mesorhizobium sp.]
MKINWSHLAIPVAGAAAAWELASVAFWEAAKPSLLTAMSVIAAGVLVRLARGLPFNNPDQFALDEVRQIAGAIKRSIRALRALIAVVFLAMGSLVFAKAINTALLAATYIPVKVAPYVEPGISAVVGFLLTYVFVRIFAVIKGDVSLADLQSDLLVKAVERKQADRFDKTLAKSDAPTMKNPEGYGKIIQ